MKELRSSSKPNNGGDLSLETIDKKFNSITGTGVTAGNSTNPNKKILFKRGTVVG